MKKKIFEKYSIIFWVLIIGSFLGFIHENLLTLLKGHWVLRQGLVYEPLIPIYGIGALVFYLVCNSLKFKNKDKIVNLLKVFLIGFLVGGAVEYLCSYVQEKWFGTISWNYSQYKFNINGRTSLLHASFWGVFGVLFYSIILPIINKMKQYLNYKYVKILTIILSIIFMTDCTISAFACYRQTERRNNLPPSNHLEQTLDKTYNDDYLNRIYNNAQTVKLQTNL